jgi:tol-pal system protein YbgF
MKLVGIVAYQCFKSRLAAGAATVALFAVATSWLANGAHAQTYTPPPATGKAAPAPKAAKAPAKAKTDDAATSTNTAADTPKSGGDAQLRQRVDQLEEQLVDLQVTIGTLESLARNPGSSSSSASSSRSPSNSSGSSSSGGADNSRVDLLETQIRALTAQVEQLSDQVRAANASSGAGAGRRAQAAPSDGPVAEARTPRPTPTPSFGTTTVTPSRSGAGDPTPDSDQIGGLINGGQAPRAATSAAGGLPGSDVGAKQLYETAYAFLLQTNYGAAETAFDDFLVRYPNDTLSGNAQYWLGESFFVRGQFKQAASAFLKGYQTYGKSAKAPDSLLKLALSLDRLGQRDAACSSFGELATKYPSASAPVKTRAENERRRMGC